jgi:hypothetical protein
MQKEASYAAAAPAPKQDSVTKDVRVGDMDAEDAPNKYQIEPYCRRIP